MSRIEKVMREMEAEINRLRGVNFELMSELRTQLDWLRHIEPRVKELTMAGSVLLGVQQSIKYISAAISKAEGRDAP